MIFIYNRQEISASLQWTLERYRNCYAKDFLRFSVHYTITAKILKDILLGKCRNESKEIMISENGKPFDIGCVQRAYTRWLCISTVPLLEWIIAKVLYKCDINNITVYHPFYAIYAC